MRESYFDFSEVGNKYENTLTSISTVCTFFPLDKYVFLSKTFGNLFIFTVSNIQYTLQKTNAFDSSYGSERSGKTFSSLGMCFSAPKDDCLKYSS